MQNIDDLLSSVRETWSKLSENKCTGTVALVDLSDSTQFKLLYPSPGIWLERLTRFLEVIRILAEETIKNPYIKYLGYSANENWYRCA